MIHYAMGAKDIGKEVGRVRAKKTHGAIQHHRQIHTAMKKLAHDHKN